MTIFASDSFAGTEGTELSAYDAVWTKVTGVTGNAEIASERLRASSTTTPAYYHSGAPASADYAVSADLYFHESGATVGPAAGVIGRCSTSANTHYMGRYAGNAGWQLFKIVAGTVTQLGVSVPEAVGAGSTKTCTLDMVGSTIRVLSDGVEKISVTDTAITAAGKAGVRFFNSTTPGDALGFHIAAFSADDGSSGTTYNQAITASATGTASIAKQPGLIVSAAVTAAVSLVKQMGASMSASATGTGVLNAIKVFLKELTSSGSGTASIQKQANLPLSASSTGSSSMSKILQTVLSVSSTGSAMLEKLKVALQTLTASGSGSASLQKQPGLTISTTSTPSASFAKEVASTLSASSTAVASLLRQVATTMAVSSAGTAVLTSLKVSLRTLSAASTVAVSFVKQPRLVLSVSSTAVAFLLKEARIALSVTASGIASLVALAGGVNVSNIVDRTVYFARAVASAMGFTVSKPKQENFTAIRDEDGEI